LLREAHELMEEAEADRAIHTLVVTSSHKSIFCPGVDLPSLADTAPRCEHSTGRSPASCGGRSRHTIAGGCMMALVGDYGVMAKGGHAFGIMEIDVGLAAPVGVVEMLRHSHGGRTTEHVLFSNERLTPEKALALGLVEEWAEPENLMERALAHARLLACKPASGYQRLKRYPARMHALGDTHLDELVDQWFSEEIQRLVVETVRRMKKPAAAPA
jgi:enoyl-CoA hydratase/carnithine racemase